jgi:hypothetical protein
MSAMQRTKGSAAERRRKISAYRLRQPVEELRRKRDKAQRRGYWTQEDLDCAHVEARLLLEKIQWR